MNIRDAIVGAKAGTLYRVGWTSNVTKDLKASAKADGITVKKIVATTIRTGVKYPNINGVVLSNSEKESPYETVVPNRIVRLKKTGEEYVSLYPINGKHQTNTYTVYVINDGKDEYRVSNPKGTIFEDLFKPSALTTKVPTKIFRIKVKDLNYFNGVCA